MPPIEELGMEQDAVLWEAGPPDDSGEPTFEPPVALEVRWEDRRSQAIGRDGNLVAILARVTVDRYIPLGSKMWKGKLADWNPSLENEVLRVETYGNVPDLMDRAELQTVGLTFASTAPPATPMRGTRKKEPTIRRAPRRKKKGGAG